VKVILGLGNPGRDYKDTRHNVGWWVLDHLADVWRLDGWRRDGETLTIGGTVAGHPVRLVKPTTYMNLSGQVLRPYLRRPAWSAASDLMVVVDEAALPFTRLRARARGSAGGHNGLKSVIAGLGSTQFPRLRLGVGRGDGRRDLADHVLAKFENGERADLETFIARAADAAEMFAVADIEKVMNTYNPDPTEPDNE